MSSNDLNESCVVCGFLCAGDFGDICPVCGWEHEGMEIINPAVPVGGPNGDLSLKEARVNFKKYGVAKLNFIEWVRSPKPSWTSHKTEKPSVIKKRQEQAKESLD